MDLQEAKEKVCDAGKLLLKEGLVARTWGNVSIKSERYIKW
jgi:ribulose-5-phosphate 4-epimerase/fuculose-1-phosphate aldolase